jgi:hypothetical protein
MSAVLGFVVFRRELCVKCPEIDRNKKMQTVFKTSKHYSWETEFIAKAKEL